jgi:predicted nucleotidyltransferase
VASLAPLQPYLRGAPPGLPFSWSVDTLIKGLNFTLTTTGGDLDLLGEITYGGTYELLVPDTEIVSVLGIECRCLSLERLIQVKRAAGRPKDFEAIAELEAIREERNR